MWSGQRLAAWWQTRRVGYLAPVLAVFWLGEALASAFHVVLCDVGPQERVGPGNDVAS